MTCFTGITPDSNRTFPKTLSGLYLPLIHFFFAPRLNGLLQGNLSGKTIEGWKIQQMGGFCFKAEDIHSRS
jgi:hypothetical protein